MTIASVLALPQMSPETLNMVLSEIPGHIQTATFRTSFLNSGIAGLVGGLSGYRLGEVEVSEVTWRSPPQQAVIRLYELEYGIWQDGERGGMARLVEQPHLYLTDIKVRINDGGVVHIDPYRVKVQLPTLQGAAHYIQKLEALAEEYGFAFGLVVEHKPNLFQN